MPQAARESQCLIPPPSSTSPTTQTSIGSLLGFGVVRLHRAGISVLCGLEAKLDWDCFPSQRSRLGIEETVQRIGRAPVEQLQPAAMATRLQKLLSSPEGFAKGRRSSTLKTATASAGISRYPRKNCTRSNKQVFRPGGNLT